MRRIPLDVTLKAGIFLFIFKLHSKTAQYAHKYCTYQSCIKLRLYKCLC